MLFVCPCCGGSLDVPSEPPTALVCVVCGWAETDPEAVAALTAVLYEAPEPAPG